MTLLIVILAMLAIFVTSLIFSQSARNFALGGVYFIGAYSPTLSRWMMAIWSWVRRRGIAITIIAVVFITTMILLLPMAVFIFAAINGQAILGLGVAAFLLLWTISKPFSQIWLLGKLTAPARILSGTLLLFLIPMLVFIIVIGEEDFNLLTSSSKELTSAKIAEVASSMDVSTSKSSKMSGIMAKISQSNVILYDDDYIEKKVLVEGELVMANPKRTKKDPETEGMTWVTSRGPSGDIINGISGWVPTRFLDYDWRPKGKSYETPSVNAGWEKVEEKVVDFSKLKMERFDQKLNFPVIPISLNKNMETGNYRIRLSGNWEFLMSSGNWRQFPWQGKTYPNNRPEYRPDKGKEFCAVILLNNGEDITPVNNEGFILASTGSVNLSLKINVLMRADEFYSEQIIDRANKLTLSNSEKEPLTITIEKEVKK